MVLPLYVTLVLVFPLLIAANVQQKPPDIYSYTSSGLGNFVFATVVVAALLAGDAISQDFSRQGYFTLTQPIRRSEIMLARTLSAFGFSLLTMLVWTGVGIGSGLAFYGSSVPNTALITLFVILFIASVVSFVILLSSLFKSSMVSVIVSVLVVWLLMPILSGVFELVKIEPWPLITYAGSVVTDLAASSYPPHVQTLSVGTANSSIVSVTIYNPYIWEAAAIMVAYLVVSLALAWLVYSRREVREVS